jgi:hypothetical protein
LVRVSAYYDRRHTVTGHVAGPVTGPVTGQQPGYAASLPHNWDTTTDSLAALLAQRVSAQELVLLKSCEVPEQWRPGDRRAAEVVDRAFAGIAHGLTCVRLVNLRACERSG